MSNSTSNSESLKKPLEKPKEQYIERNHDKYSTTSSQYRDMAPVSHDPRDSRNFPEEYGRNPYTHQGTIYSDQRGSPYVYREVQQIPQTIPYDKFQYGPPPTIHPYHGQTYRDPYYEPVYHTYEPIPRDSRYEVSRPVVEKERQPDPGNLHVSGLGENVTIEQLKEVFGKFGKLKSARLPKDIYTEKHRGYAFITFEDIESAKKTLKEAILVDGKEVKVEFAKEGPKKRDSKPIRHDPYIRDYHQPTVHFTPLT